MGLVDRETLVHTQMYHLHTMGPWAHDLSLSLSPFQPSSQRYDHHMRKKAASTGPDI